MSQIQLRKVRKSFANVAILNDVDLTIAPGEFCVFIGPSGCGKSTLLRLIAGLDDVSGGEIVIDGQVVNELPPAQRNVAMVFQSYALYPHMSVHENMAFGLRHHKLPEPEIERRVAEAAAMLKLEALLERKPRQLSGGQRQRVAIGRAIVRQPKVFLFDEPLSNLDAALRINTRVEIALPKGPGLGVEVDRDKLAHYAEYFKKVGGYTYDRDPGRPDWYSIQPEMRYADPTAGH